MKDQDIEKYIGCCFDSDKFCELFPNLSKKLVKLTNSEECHYGLQFKTGFNEDLLTFNPKGECEPGGIYIADEENIPMWLEYAYKYMKYCRKVELCYNSKIYIEKDNKFKVDKLILGERVEIKDLPGWSDKEYCLKSLKLSAGNPFFRTKGCAALKFIKNIDEDIQIEALRNNWRSLNYFLESGIILSEKVQMEAVIQSPGFNFQVLLENNMLPSFEIQLIAAKKYGFMLFDLIGYLVKNDIYSSLSKKIVLEALKSDCKAIFSFCHHNLDIPSEYKIAAVKGAKVDGYALHILLQHKIPITEEEQMLILRHNWKCLKVFSEFGINISDEDIQIEALRNNSRFLKYFLGPGIILSEKVQMEAVIQDSTNFSVLLEYNILPSFEIQLIAVKKSGYMLEYLIEYLMKNKICSSLPEEIVLEAIKQEGVLIRSLCRYNLHISSEMKIEAVKNSKRALKILLEYNIPITEEEQMLILRHNWKCLKVFSEFGINISDEVKRYANEQLLLLPLSMDNRILFL